MPDTLTPYRNIKYFTLFFNFILFLSLKHCISFAKHQNESATGKKKKKKKEISNILKVLVNY